MFVFPSSFFFCFFFLALGLVIGSFVSAVSYRYPLGIDFKQGRSFCPNCKKKISWFDNIPLLSYILLAGKCRNCKRKISPRYPLIELFMGIGFLITYFLFSPSPLVLIFNLSIFSLLVLIFVVDLEHQIIPDGFIFFGIGLLLLPLLLTQSLQPFSFLFGGFLAASFLMLIHLLTGGRGMGLGDVKFAVFGGILVGLRLMPVWIFSSFLTGGMVGIILILGKKAGLKDKIAFGPFLVIGIIITLLWGENIKRLLL